MTEWPVSCFKAYDIRGLSGQELSDEFAYRLGRALATYLECNSFAVGRDIRESSPGYASNLIQGLVDSGVRVLDLGIVSTGCVYHACWTLPVDGGVMVTASHLPMPTHNGFKMCRGTLPLAGEEIQELKDVFLEGAFREGEGEHIDHPHEDTYLQAIIDSTGKLARPVKVAVDCGNAVPGPAMTKLLDMIGAEHIDLYCDWDNTEPNHGADPTREYNMVDLAKAVVDNGCEFGLGADGDGDRIGAVDENGDFVYPDRLIALLAEDVVGSEEGKGNKLTKETIINGYLHTGDIGTLDAEGFLKITDRKKEMFKTSGGKYIAPAVLEQEFKKSRFIEQIMIIGEHQKMPAALIQVPIDVVNEWARRHDYVIDDMTTDVKFLAKMQREIDTHNIHFGKWEQIKKFEITPDIWSIESGHLTPTMKMRRKIITKKYAHLIEKIYNR